MRVKNINWICKEAQEAIVTVTDGKYFCDAFCHPCWFHPGEEILNPLVCFDEKYLIKTDLDIMLQKKDFYFQYKIIANVIDKTKNVVGIGGIKIELSCRWIQGRSATPRLNEKKIH